LNEWQSPPVGNANMPMRRLVGSLTRRLKALPRLLRMTFGAAGRVVDTSAVLAVAAAAAAEILVLFTVPRRPERLAHLLPEQVMFLGTFDSFPQSLAYMAFLGVLIAGSLIFSARTSWTRRLDVYRPWTKRLLVLLLVGLLAAALYSVPAPTVMTLAVLVLAAFVPRPLVPMAWLAVAAWWRSRSCRGSSAPSFFRRASSIGSTSTTPWCWRRESGLPPAASSS